LLCGLVVHGPPPEPEHGKSAGRRMPSSGATISSYELNAAGFGDPPGRRPPLVAFLGDGRLKHWHEISAWAFRPGRQVGWPRRARRHPESFGDPTTGRGNDVRLAYTRKARACRCVQPGRPRCLAPRPGRTTPSGFLGHCNRRTAGASWKGHRTASHRAGVQPGRARYWPRGGRASGNPGPYGCGIPPPGKSCDPLDAHLSTVHALAFSPPAVKGRTLASGSDDGRGETVGTRRRARRSARSRDTRTPPWPASPSTPGGQAWASAGGQRRLQNAISTLGGGPNGQGNGGGFEGHGLAGLRRWHSARTARVAGLRKPTISRCVLWDPAHGKGTAAFGMIAIARALAFSPGRPKPWPPVGTRRTITLRDLESGDKKRFCRRVYVPARSPVAALSPDRRGCWPWGPGRYGGTPGTRRHRQGAAYSAGTQGDGPASSAFRPDGPRGRLQQ